MRRIFQKRRDKYETKKDNSLSPRLQLNQTIYDPKEHLNNSPNQLLTNTVSNMRINQSRNQEPGRVLGQKMNSFDVNIKKNG